MKAYLKTKKRKEIEVEFVGNARAKNWYVDKNTRAVYTENDIELKEYYGG